MGRVTSSPKGVSHGSAAGTHTQHCSPCISADTTCDRLHSQLFANFRPVQRSGINSKSLLLKKAEITLEIKVRKLLILRKNICSEFDSLRWQMPTAQMWVVSSSGKLGHPSKFVSVFNPSYSLLRALKWYSGDSVT